MNHLLSMQNAEMNMMMTNMWRCQMCICSIRKNKCHSTLTAFMSAVQSE